jgi:hypothetical protein
MQAVSVMQIQAFCQRDSATRWLTSLGPFIDVFWNGKHDAVTGELKNVLKRTYDIKKITWLDVHGTKRLRWWWKNDKGEYMCRFWYNLKLENAAVDYVFE